MFAILAIVFGLIYYYHYGVKQIFICFFRSIISSCRCVYLVVCVIAVRQQWWVALVTCCLYGILLLFVSQHVVPSRQKQQHSIFTSLSRLWDSSSSPIMLSLQPVDYCIGCKLQQQSQSLPYRIFKTIYFLYYFQTLFILFDMMT